MRLDEWFQLAYRASARAAVSQRVSVAGSWDVTSLLAAAGVGCLLLLSCALVAAARRRRLHSALAVLWAVGSGAGLLTALWHPAWSVMTGDIRAPLAFSSRRPVSSHLAVQFGLRGADLTLTPAPAARRRGYGAYNFREQLLWPETPAGMSALYRSALRRGVASPLVQALEVLSKEAGPCTYGRHLRRAGYLAGWLAAAAVGCWALAAALLATVPALAARAMLATAAAAAGAAAVYVALMPGHQLVLLFDGAAVTLRLGWCLWLSLAVAVLNVAAAGYIAVQQRCRSGGFTSLFELDFDMPRHRAGWRRTDKASALAAGDKRPAVAVKQRRNELTLNIDFSDEACDGVDTPSDNRFFTPVGDVQTPFWSPGSMPRRPRPSPSVTAAANTLNTGPVGVTTTISAALNTGPVGTATSLSSALNTGPVGAATSLSSALNTGPVGVSHAFAEIAVLKPDNDAANLNSTCVFPNKSAVYVNPAFRCDDLADDDSDGECEDNAHVQPDYTARDDADSDGLNASTRSGCYQRTPRKHCLNLD